MPVTNRKQHRRWHSVRILPESLSSDNLGFQAIAEYLAYCSDARPSLSTAAKAFSATETQLNRSSIVDRNVIRLSPP